MHPNVTVRVISLVGSPRRARIEEQFRTLPIEWAFFDALVGAPPDIPYNAAKARRWHGRDLSPGELGCFASHRALWHLAAEGDPSGILLVLEDDVLLDPHFFSQVGAVAEAAARYPYLRLYAKYPENIWCEGPFLDRYVARLGGRAYGTQAYFITPEGARRFLGAIKEVVRPVDDEMDRFWSHGVPNRAVFPFPVLEVNQGSTLMPEREAEAAVSVGEVVLSQAMKAAERTRRHASARLLRTADGLRSFRAACARVSRTLLGRRRPAPDRRRAGGA